jgi:hypothetical protein
MDPAPQPELEFQYGSHLWVGACTFLEFDKSDLFW